MRGLSDVFMNDLKNEEGILNPILERVKQDDTLMFAIREDYINIYYRGGNILKLKGPEGPYNASFNNDYNKLNLPCANPPSSVGSRAESQEWVDAFQNLKGIMDCYFSKKRKAEREFQQLVVRENNFSPVANGSEYFITDIELADTELGTRIDIIALRWLTKQRKSTTDLCPALIEMKYGDNALTEGSGMIEHLKQMSTLVANPAKYKNLLEMMEVQFNQMDKLGLLEFKRTKNWAEIKLDAGKKPEIIFILANHNPRSTRLTDILNDPQMDAYASSEAFDLKFCVSSFAGYAMHADSMLTLSKLKDLCTFLNLPSKKNS